MSSIGCFFGSSIGQKLIVAITGLGWSGFILTHMAANMLILGFPKQYNLYSHTLISNPLLIVAEVGLLVLLLLHVSVAAKITLDNRRAKGATGNASKVPCCASKAARFGSRSMILTGLLVLVFLVFHLITFKYGTYYSVSYDGVEMRDLHRLVIEKFQSPLYVAWYLFALVVLGVHLSHGFSSLFQTLGISSVRYPAIRKVGWTFAVVIAAGFISQPLYALLFGGR